MSRHHIEETCACGAKFSYAAEYSSEATRAATAWRTEHRHEPATPEPIQHGDRGDCIATGYTVGFVGSDE